MMLGLPPLLLIFLLGLGLNLVWEFSHCRLYETCRRQSWRDNAPLLIKMSIKDSLFIILFYLITVWIFGAEDFLNNQAAIAFFMALGLGFSFIDETVSLRLKRWEYAPIMPTVLGVGITPLLEIAVTGLATLFIVFRLLPA